MSEKKSCIQLDVPKEVVVSNCTFKQGVFWEKEAVEAVTLVAKALLNLTELFKMQSSTFGPAIEIKMGQGLDSEDQETQEEKEAEDAEKTK